VPETPINEVDRIAVPETANGKSGEVAQYGYEESVSGIDDSIVNQNGRLEYVKSQKVGEGYVPPLPKLSQIC
jgi:hypothetical protein